jgi:4-hydroxythreonine-4-phosphate dehydrogenase
MTADNAAPVVLTCGDPSGIGPECAAGAQARLAGAVPLVWLGDPRHLPPGTPVVMVDDVSEGTRAGRHGLPVLVHRFAAPAVPGRPDPANAQGVVDVIARAVALVRSGACAAMTTGPIHKKVLYDGAGFAFPGHTEYLAHLAGVSHVAMMLACDTLRVVPATIHIPLAEVPRALSRGLLSDTVRLTHAALIRDFGIPAPRIAVAGLNPHAGEGGAMGTEEITLIAPVLEALRAEGFDLTGPLSADTLFHAAARARYDAAVCMYHDQALIPIKTIAFDDGVNVTLGLPFVRTSPDHGTAFDIAGKGLANPASTVAAIRMAWAMAQARAGAARTA